MPRIQAGSGGAGGAVTDSAVATQVTSGTATQAALRAAFVPKWKASTAYAAGDPVLNPSGQVVTANASFTSGATYNAANWTVVSGGGGTVSDATTGAKGIVQLAGDLGGTAASPTVPGLAGKLPKAGGTMTGTLTLAGDPVGALDAATKRYADGAGVFFTVKTFGTVGDVKTLTDGAISAGSANLTSASAAFVSGDVGKTVVVPQAGAVNSATTLSAALSTGAAITSLPVAATSAITPVGPVIVTSGANVQAFYVTTQAAAGATALTVTSQTPSFAFPIGSTVATTPHSLITTIASVQSGTSVTLAATATTAVTAAEVVYGTDDTAALQNAINAAQTAKAGLYVAPPSGEGYLITAALVISAHLRMFGSGVTETFGTAIGTGADALNFPVAAPHFQGSVFVVAAENTDGLKITAAGANANLDDLGIRFAGLFRFTGHGFNVAPPADGGNFDNGLMSSTFLRLKVFGHDGDHYAFNIVNSEYCTFFNLRGYGGGGIQFVQQSSRCNCGNAVVEHPFFVTSVIGTAHNFNFNVVTGTSNLYTFIRAQGWTRPMTYAPGANLAPVGGTAGQHNVMQNSATALKNITWIAPDMETSIGSTCKWPVLNNYIVGAGQTTTPEGVVVTSFATGTSYQNTLGSQQMMHGDFLLSPTAGAAATVDIYVSASATVASGSHVHSISLPANSAAQLWSAAWVLVPGWYYSVVMVNATRAWSFAQGVDG